MSKDEADSLRDRRKEEQPQFEWVVQRRAADDWAVLRLPGNAGRASRAGPTVDDALTAVRVAFAAGTAT